MAEDTAEQLLLQFCADLRRLWTEAGGPSLRALPNRVGLGKSQIGAILSGRVRQPPDWTVVRALVASFHRYARERGVVSQLSVSSGVDEFWRPRHTLLIHAYGQLPPTRRAVSEPDRDAGERLVPRQLPCAPRHFVGRANELAGLTKLVTDDRGGATAIAVVAGPAGIGKTALAVRWAHQVRDRFPDGQLHLNLHGYGNCGPAIDPAEAFRRFLVGLGVRPARAPATPDASADLYRSLLAERRVLVLLDNAGDADQVRPLLPGSPGCLVVVTSRDPLTSLVAREGAHPLALGPLSPGESRELLVGRIGARRLAAEPQAVDEILIRCAGFPLALAFVAARAEVQPDLPIRTAAR